MKKSKLLIALACFGLLVTGCNKPAASSEGSKPASASGTPSSAQSAQPSSNQPSSTPSSSAPVVEDKYYSVPLGYDTATKWEKGHEYKWTFKLTKNYTKVTFAFGAQMSSSSHSDRSLYTNHEGASTDDPFESNEANDGTCRIVLKVNGVEQTITHDTYGEAGLTNTEINYYKVAEFAVNAGDVEVSMTTHAQTGYRLMLGEEVRLYYKDADESATPTVTPTFEGYKVSFTGEHCKVYIYDTKDYTKTPKEANNCIARDEDGNIVAYDPEDEQLQPQVNFKVVCDEGYSLNASNFKITGKYNKLKQGPSEADGLPGEEYFRITKVQEDLAVVITPVQGTQAKGYKISFVPTNCTIKVYVGAKNADGTNLDTPENGIYYGRAKDAPYDISFASPQLNFEVVCNEGYEFKPVIENDKVNFITFAEAEDKVGYNKFKDNNNGTYNITKIDSDLTITIAATEKQALPPEPPVDGTKVTKTVADLATDNSWANEAVVNTLTIGEVDITLTGDNGDTKYYSSNSTLRVYVLKNGGAGSVAFAAKTGYKIVSVKVTFSWNKNVGTCPLASGETKEVNDTSATYAIANADTANNEQMRITAFEIVYKAA